MRDGEKTHGEERRPQVWVEVREEKEYTKENRRGRGKGSRLTANQQVPSESWSDKLICGLAANYHGALTPALQQ